MSSINKSNIDRYLLHLNQYLTTKFDTATIDKWKQLNDDQIPKYLQRLYNTQGISANQIAEYEQDFIQGESLQPSSAAPPVEVAPSTRFSPSYTPPQSVSKKRNPAVPILIGLLLLVGGVATYPYLDDYFKDKYQNSSPSDDYTQPVQTSNSYSDATEDAAMDVTDAVTEEASYTTDQNHADAGTDAASSSSGYSNFSKDRAIDNLASLIMAEDNHNSYDAINYYSPKINQYWDMKNPTKAELLQRYDKSFDKVSQSRNEVVSSEWTGPRTLEALIKFSYVGANTGESKTVYTRMRYGFDENGLINYANKVN